MNPKTLQELSLIAAKEHLCIFLLQSEKFFQTDIFKKMFLLHIKQFGIATFMNNILMIPDTERRMLVDALLCAFTEEHASTMYVRLLEMRMPHAKIVKLCTYKELTSALGYIYKTNPIMVHMNLYKSIAFKFRPNIMDIISSFQYINFFDENGKPFELTYTQQTKELQFIEKILEPGAADGSEIVPKESVLECFYPENVSNISAKYHVQDKKHVIITEILELTNKICFGPILDFIIEKATLNQLLRYKDDTETGRLLRKRHNLD